VEGLLTILAIVAVALGVLVFKEYNFAKYCFAFAAAIFAFEAVKVELALPLLPWSMTIAVIVTTVVAVMAYLRSAHWVDSKQNQFESDKLTREAPPHLLTPAPPAPLAPRPRTEAPSRTFTTIEPKALVAFYYGRTMAEGDRLAEPYKGLWLRVSGKVSDVATHPTYWSVSIMESTEPLVVVIGSFDDHARWKSALSVLRVGQPVTISGQIARIASSTVAGATAGIVGLDNAELVDG
jgi:tRNA_anti-like